MPGPNCNSWAVSMEDLDQKSNDYGSAAPADSTYPERHGPCHFAHGRDDHFERPVTRFQRGDPPRAGWHAFRNTGCTIPQGATQWQTKAESWWWSSRTA